MRSAPVAYPRFLPVLFIVVLVLSAVLVLYGLNENAARMQEVMRGEATIQAELDLAQTERVHLMATRDYVNSDAYVEQYNRDEANRILPGEVRVQVLTIEATPLPATSLEPTPDPALYARPWQLWWHLLTDAPVQVTP